MEDINKELLKLFRTQDFKTFLISKLHHVPGNPFLVLHEKDELYPDVFSETTLVCEFEPSIYDEFEESTVPSEEVKDLCIEYLRSNDLELYEKIKNFRRI